MMRQISNLTFQQTVEIFGQQDVVNICRAKEMQFTDDLFEKRKKDRQLLQQYAEAKEKNKWFIKYIREELEKEINKLRSSVRYWQYKKKQARGEVSNAEWVDKEELKQIPMEKVMSFLGYQPVFQGSNRSSYKIRENEKTASFMIFHKTNSWYDFGVSLGGDNIAFLQWLYNINFKEAIKLLKDML